MLKIWRDRSVEKKDRSPTVTKPMDAYAALLANNFESPGYLKSKPFLLLGIALPFFDVILDFIGAGIG